LHALSTNQLDQYHADGYVIPDFRFPTAVIDEIRAAHRRFVRKYPQFIDYCPTLLHYDLSFLNYARFPAILEMVAQILGQDLILWNSSLFAKPPHRGRKTPWHQDGEYWPIRPLATCTVWIALDDSTRDNGCLQVIPGSHKERRLLRHETNASPDLTLNQELPTSAFDESQAVDLVLESGQISLHDVYLVHGSEANRSARPRRGMTLRYMPSTSLFDRDAEVELYRRLNSTGPIERSIFLVRGTDRHGRNDFSMKAGDLG
jgi:ectoine hydroxylase-related dioxygenase (phytanoyl-CoA dioxygenase family)